MSREQSERKKTGLQNSHSLNALFDADATALTARVFACGCVSVRVRISMSCRKRERERERGCLTMPVGLLPIFCFCCNDPTHSYVTFSAKTQLESILVDVLFLSFCFRNFFATQKKKN